MIAGLAAAVIHGQVPFDPDTGEVFDRPPSVHRLPGME